MVKASEGNKTYSTSSPEGLHLKVYVIADNASYPNTDLLLEKVQEANDLMAAAANVHLHIVGLEVIETEPFDKIRVEYQAKESYLKSPYDAFIRLFNKLEIVSQSGMLVSHPDVTELYRLCTEKAITSVYSAASDNGKASTIAYGLFRVILAKHKDVGIQDYGCGCRGNAGDHRRCITDPLGHKLTTVHACSCWKEAVTFLLNGIIKYPNGGSLDCLKTKPEYTPNGSPAVHPLLRNGVREGNEECDCAFRDKECKKICNDGGTFKPTNAPAFTPEPVTSTIKPAKEPELSSAVAIILIVVIVVVVLAIIGVIGYMVYKKKSTGVFRPQASSEKQVEPDLRSEIKLQTAV